MLLSGKFTFLGFITRVSQKTNNSYTVVNVCDNGGNTINCMCLSSAVSAVSGLERFKEYIFDFEYNSTYKDLKLSAVRK